MFFNEFEIDGEAISFESELTKIETRAAPILMKIVKSKSVADLTTQERKRVADFIAAQSFRTEAFYKGINVDLEQIS